MALQLSTRYVLNLELAKAIAAAAEGEAQQHGWVVSIAIVDDGGRLLYFQRMDDTTNASVEVSIGKALHAVNYRRPTKFHEDLLSGGNMVVLGLPGGLPVEGGLPLVAAGCTLGAIGVAGAQSNQDGQIAAAGAALLDQFNPT
jgi:glc operon protein GlcG